MELNRGNRKSQLRKRRVAAVVLEAVKVAEVVAALHSAAVSAKAVAAVVDLAEACSRDHKFRRAHLAAVVSAVAAQAEADLAGLPAAAVEIRRKHWKLSFA